MKKLLAAAVIVLALVTMLSSGCNKLATELKPYEYTGTSEIKQVEYYETERIRDAERTVVMTLEQLGYYDLGLMGGEVESPAMAYTLPDDATQGPDKWFIVNFHFLIEFEEDTGGGFCEVRASPLGSVELETQKVNDAPFIRVGGQSVTSTRVDVHYYNYMGISDVKPGKNEMSFKYTEYQGTKIKSVTVFNDTGIELTSVPPYDESIPPPEAVEAFYGVSPELTARLEQICLADPRIRELLKDREYSFIVDGHTIENKDYNFALGVRLKDDITSEQFREWMHGGRQDSSIIREYVGVLNIGYNEKYHIVIDVDKKELSELIHEEKSGTGIPELTMEDKQHAIEIALADTTVQKILAGKQYELAPEGRIGIWHKGDKKLGVIFEVHFDKPYFISYEVDLDGKAPPYLFSGEVKVITVNVLLEENRVTRIIPHTPAIVD
jgi:hypothetical protein